MKKLCLIIPLFLIPINLFAEYGCLVPGYPELLINQSNPPGGTFFNTPALYPDPGCSWQLDTTMPYAGCVGHASGGVKGKYVQACPIDDYIPLLFIFTAGFAFFQIRKGKLLLKDEDLYHNRSL